VKYSTNQIKIKVRGRAESSTSVRNKTKQQNWPSHDQAISIYKVLKKQTRVNNVVVKSIHK
jgi:hypothetical protein